MRHKHLMELARAAAKNDNKSEEQHYKSMANAKNFKETFRILQNINKPEDQSGIRQIDIPTGDPSGNETTRGEGSTKMTTLADPAEV